MLRCYRKPGSHSVAMLGRSLLCVLAVLAGARSSPHIIMIIADDLGWNDVGFHGMNHIPTPNIDALAASGTILQNYYVGPICTPSRAALMTGKYPIHTGMQHGVLYGQEPRGLPLSETILPQYLKKLGYKTHLVGKWHLGSYKKEYLPLNRGFDSHVGFWTGKIDMYDHTTMERGSWGTDFRRGFSTAHDLFGKYVTDIYTDEAVKVIEAHNKTEPLFLMVAHSAVHTGNPYTPIRAPDELIDTFKHINDSQRQRFAGVLTKLDESVGMVVAALEARGLLQNSVILFTTDNGGAPAGFNDNAGSNYPLRGTKNTLWEGGVRGAAFLWSLLLDKHAHVSHQMVHIADWLPTLFTIAGGHVSALGAIDGKDQWGAISRDDANGRTSVVHNIDSVGGTAAITVGHWKVINGTNYNGAWDEWYGPEGREGTYNIDLTYKSAAARAARRLGLMPTKADFMEMRTEATVTCNEAIQSIQCKPLKTPCLFNIKNDPCEQKNLAAENPDIYAVLLAELTKVNSTAIPPNNRPLEDRGDPKYWGRVYTNFGDYENSV